MTRARRRLILLLLAAACLVIALAAKAATGSGGNEVGRAVALTVTPPTISIPDDLRVPEPKWAKPRLLSGDVISVRGTKCPKSHPHKAGSSSTGSWTQINGGKVEHRSSRRTLCAR